MMSILPEVRAGIRAEKAIPWISTPKPCSLPIASITSTIMPWMAFVFGVEERERHAGRRGPDLHDGLGAGGTAAKREGGRERESS